MKNKQVFIWLIAAGILVVVALANAWQSGGDDSSSRPGTKTVPC